MGSGLLELLRLVAQILAGGLRLGAPRYVQQCGHENHRFVLTLQAHAQALAEHRLGSHRTPFHEGLEVFGQGLGALVSALRTMRQRAINETYQRRGNRSLQTLDRTGGSRSNRVQHEH